MQGVWFGTVMVTVYSIHSGSSLLKEDVLPVNTLEEMATIARRLKILRMLSDLASIMIGCFTNTKVLSRVTKRNIAFNLQFHLTYNLRSKCRTKYNTGAAELGAQSAHMLTQYLGH